MVSPIGTMVEVDAPPNDVWAVLHDVERWPEWTPTMRSVTRLDHGLFRVGSTARVRQPRMLPAVWEVTRLEEGRAFTWISRTPGLTIVADHVVASRSAGSRVTLSIRFTGLLAGVIGRMYHGLAQRYIDIEAARLKLRCERVQAAGTASTAHV